MDPVILLAAGIAIIVLIWVSARLGQWTTLDIRSEDQARALFAVEKPDFAISETYVAPDGKCALFWSAPDGGSPALGLIRPVGDKIATRILTARTLKAVEVLKDLKSDRHFLRVRLRDATFSRLTVVFKSKDDAVQWQHRLNQIAGFDRKGPSDEERLS